MVYPRGQSAWKVSTERMQKQPQLRHDEEKSWLFPCLLLFARRLELALGFHSVWTVLRLLVWKRVALCHSGLSIAPFLALSPSSFYLHLICIAWPFSSWTKMNVEWGGVQRPLWSVMMISNKPVVSGNQLSVFMKHGIWLPFKYLLLVPGTPTRYQVPSLPAYLDYDTT